VADHIKINTAELRSISETLKRLKEEFEGASNIVDHYSGFLGSGRMADTLHEFATNWDVHKKSILSDVDRLAQVSGDAANAWDGLDRDLAKALTDAEDKAKKAG
jgi:hypothetical protein